MYPTDVRTKVVGLWQHSGYREISTSSVISEDTLVTPMYKSSIIDIYILYQYTWYRARILVLSILVLKYTWRAALKGPYLDRRETHHGFFLWRFGRQE